MSLYLPKRYESNDPVAAMQVMREFPFATVITAHPEGCQVSQLPLLAEMRGEKIILVGHLARANPHWKLLAMHKTIVQFQGPNAYITPTWYEHCDVPTWNYVTVHGEGRAKLLESEAEVTECVRALSAAIEPADGWKFEVPEDLQGKLAKAIVGFELGFDSWQLKCKLSQNKTPQDFENVIAGLKKRSDDGSKQVSQWMQALKASRAEKP